MPKADILFDKTEFVLRMADKQAMTMNIRADQITTITFQPTMQKKLFKKIPSEVMLIKTKAAQAAPAAPAAVPTVCPSPRKRWRARRRVLGTRQRSRC